MDVKKLINEKIQRMQDLNRQMGEISKKIGTLQEEGRALHSAALELRGGIESLAELDRQQDEELKKSETAKLILPEGVKPIVTETPASPAPDAPAPVVQAPAAPITLEVQ